MATHSSILAWKTPWTEEPGRLQSTGSQRVGCDWATEHHHQVLLMLAINTTIQDSEKQAADEHSTGHYKTHSGVCGFPIMPFALDPHGLWLSWPYVHSSQCWIFRVCLLPVTLTLLKLFCWFPLNLDMSNVFSRLQWAHNVGKKCCVLGHHNGDNTASICLLASSVHLDIMVRWISLR